MIERIRAEIERNFAKSLRVPQLARRAGLSTFHFIRVFRRGTGLTPHQYVRRCRIERAKHLLTTTSLSVTEICDAVGFESLGSFSALFGRLTGHSPSEYRRRTRRVQYIPGCFLRMYRAEPSGDRRGPATRSDVAGGSHRRSATSPAAISEKRPSESPGTFPGGGTR